MEDTIFMIHGMFNTDWYWEVYKNFFEKKGCNCVTTTLRFHTMDPKGIPDPRLGTTSLLDFATDLEKEIKQLEKRPILMGHSMGGLLAQILGARDLAKALVLLTPAAPAGILAIRPSVIKSMWSVLKKWGNWKIPIRMTFEEAAYGFLNLLPIDEQRETYDKFVYESGRAGFEFGNWFLDSTRASKIDETKVTCPVLVIGAGQDRVTPASVVRKVAQKYSSVSTYKEFEKHAHWVIAEPGCQEIAEYIDEWLQKTSL